MRFKSQILTAASGSVGGLTYSHNAGGMYTRARATPTNPNSPAQNIIRNAVALLVARWTNTLLAAQRVGWATYGENVPLLDVFGDPRNRSGINHYVRSNVPRIQFAFAIIDDPPTTFNLGDFTAPTYSAGEASQDVSITFTEADSWVGEDDAALLIWQGRPQSPGVNFFVGPYRATTKIAGDSGSPPTTPATVTSPFALAEGQRVFLRSRVMRADGRLSADARNFLVVAA